MVSFLNEVCNWPIFEEGRELDNSRHLMNEYVSYFIPPNYPKVIS